MASLISPREHPGVVALSYRQHWWKEPGWFPLASRVLQLGYPSLFAPLKRTHPVWLEAEERLDQISRVTLEASVHEYEWRDRQHRLLSNLPLGRVEALIVGYNLSAGRDAQVRGRSHTSDSESAKLGMTLVVKVPVILGDHRDKWEASLYCEVEGALLEWP